MSCFTCLSYQDLSRLPWLLCLHRWSSRTPFLLTPLTNLSFTLVLFSVTETWLPDIITRTTLSNGYLGSGNDEERSEPRYVMRIAVLRESSNLWTQLALLGYSWEHASLSIGFNLSLWLLYCDDWVDNESLIGSALISISLFKCIGFWASDESFCGNTG